ncbi:SDR family oxidoreductase [Rhodococcus tibetensis]|uniref:SDR family oxidoreductase n=1 Tax=Rhodococcus tibetensis TaxID=2965064 RepID=A0ABT1QB20_9NOCA|nr:SDR family oxidoreductase [Rhodococcus sp. FXJ9.536]MCQ4119463.1 SDR family oxidoreductase [Rhodococcus sp. FXJ9.536]
MTIAVTGATGSIGGNVLQRLGGGAGVRLIGRNAQRLEPLAEHFDSAFAVATYADGPAMTAALDGVRLLFFVSGHESATRREEHRTAVDAARAAGVERIVYLSFLGAAPECTFTFGRDHYFTEQHIRESGLKYTFLQDSWYQSMIPLMADDQGVIRGPAEDGRVSAVAPDDVADAVTAVLTTGNGDHDGATYRLTGPEAFTLTEAAETITTVTGRSVRFQNETLDEAYASRAHYGAPQFEVDGWVTSYAAIAAGELAVVTGDVETLTGRPAQTFADYLNSYT